MFDDLSRDKNDFKRFSASAKPQIIPEKGYIDYSKPLTVVVSSADDNAEIHYTTDGTLPTVNSLQYIDPLKLNQTTVVKAISFAKDKLPSVVSTSAFSKSLPVVNVVYNLPTSQRRSGWERTLVDLNEGTTEGGTGDGRILKKGILMLHSIWVKQKMSPKLYAVFLLIMMLEYFFPHQLKYRFLRIIKIIYQ